MFHRWVFWQVFAGKHLTDLTLDVMIQCHLLWLEERKHVIIDRSEPPTERIYK